MESVINFICMHADQAHYIFFFLILLAGLNVPISEDIMLLIGGAIASTCIPEHALQLYLWIFAACLIAAWEAYWIGRLFGPKLYNIRFFSHIITPGRIERLHQYYERFGILVFIIGRFIPGGVRNAIFLTSGLGKMPFPVFVARDFVGCLLSTALLFYLGYVFGANHEIILKYFHNYELGVLGLATLALFVIIIILIIKRVRRRT